MSKRINSCLIGIPDHQGVINVKGRIGAARGPELFRRYFQTLRGRAPVRESLTDLGNIQGISADIDKNHTLAIEAVSEAHARFAVSLVVGGGHDHGYSHLLGVSRGLSQSLGKKARVGCINLDAHLDVRKPDPKITSGSPFYLALERSVIEPKNLIEFGIQEHCNSPELWDYVSKKKVKVVSFDALRGRASALFKKALKELSARCDAIVVSLDLDSIAEAHAPGVSAPQPEGFSATDAMEMVELAGLERKVVSLGIFELNPEHDTDDRTSRLAATCGYHFIARAGARKSSR